MMEEEPVPGMERVLLARRQEGFVGSTRHRRVLRAKPSMYDPLGNEEGGVWNS
ncbi:hypothetical protein [Paenibacillus arenosi]|uniref:Uncharacterized protein n=1 Tax=Paenibacillus arenosi TaxID=2774142 RepID=A0ABR9B2C6_9BACL|nr:hypothetical protein [Paenibacillus arenosi]MBD8500522.1 hypothetical protein [Paenibacillus arenosi]